MRFFFIVFSVNSMRNLLRAFSPIFLRNCGFSISFIKASDKAIESFDGIVNAST